MYTKEYYQSFNYSDYLDRKERYTRLALELYNFLKILGLKEESKYLDYGCAVGFLVEAMGDLGLESYGVDISDWALSEGKRKGLKVTNSIPKKSFSICTLLDVLEHMKEEDLDNLFMKLKASIIIFRIPVPANKGEDYYLKVSRLDSTHITKWTKEQWTKFFNNYGYTVKPLNLYTIFDSKGVFCGIGFKNGRD